MKMRQESLVCTIWFFFFFFLGSGWGHLGNFPNLYSSLTNSLLAEGWKLEELGSMVLISLQKKKKMNWYHKDCGNSGREAPGLLWDPTWTHQEEQAGQEPGWTHSQEAKHPCSAVCSCLTLGMWFDLSKPWFPYPQMGDHNPFLQDCYKN